MPSPDEIQQRLDLIQVLLDFRVKREKRLTRGRSPGEVCELPPVKDPVQHLCRGRDVLPAETHHFNEEGIVAGSLDHSAVVL